MITFNYRPKYGDAVISLTNGGASGPTDGPISEWQFDKDKTPPTEEQIQAKLAELQAEYDAQQYARTRRPLYPDIGDQLDDLYKKGAFSDEMAAKIKKVKDDNPKPS
tara:strand:+ start:1201 stop:1521 length:321 start_codon:yes stop_codon:yes gene_type:complete